MTEIALDTFDLRILLALQDDGRLTGAELAEKAGLSPSQCARRRAALEEAGVIARYAALVDPERVGLDVTAFVEVTLHAHSHARDQDFSRLVNRLDEVQEAHSLTGEADYLLRLTVPDLKTLAHILNNVLLAHESVARIHSSIVLNRIKQTTRLPLGHLAR